MRMALAFVLFALRPVVAEDAGNGYEGESPDHQEIDQVKRSRRISS